MKMNTTIGPLRLVSASLSLLACLAATSLRGQVQATGVIADRAGAIISESGPDYRSWQTLDAIRANTPGNGRMVELATGMNYWDGTNWSPSVAQFQANPQDSSFVA